MLTTLLFAATLAASAQATAPADRPAVTVQQISYTQLDGTTNAATLVAPAPATARAGRPATLHPAILFVHWYEPPKPTSNRTEFLPDAIDLAAQGVVSLLIDTPWTKEDWFPTRNGDNDYDFSVAYVKELRHAIDVLLQQPNVDKTRVAYVGHDFGAMYGAVAVAQDPRITHFVYMAGTRSFSDWFLFTPKREGAAREAFIAKLAPLDPIVHLAKISPRPVLLQFGGKDRFVSPEAAQAQADAIAGPKTVKTYPTAEHELTFEARIDRLGWLRDQFKIGK